MRPVKCNLIKATALIGIPVALLVFVWSCKTPSFPLPPPSPEGMVIEPYSQDGLVQFSGEPNTVPAEVEVHIFNLDRGFGYYFYADSDGSFQSPPMEALEGERLQFYYTNDNDTSRPLCFVVSFNQSPPPSCQ
jgi:hypothetical protein